MTDRQTDRLLAGLSVRSFLTRSENVQFGVAGKVYTLTGIDWKGFNSCQTFSYIWLAH